MSTRGGSEKSGVAPRNPRRLREIPGRFLEISGEWCAQTQRGPRDGPSRGTRRWWVKHRSVLTDFTTLFHFLPRGLFPSYIEVFSRGYSELFPGYSRVFSRGYIEVFSGNIQGSFPGDIREYTRTISRKYSGASLDYPVDHLSMPTLSYT